MNTHAEDLDRAKRPQVGDWWHDYFCPYCLVVAVDEETVTITKDYEQGPRMSGQWRWPEQPTRLEQITRDEFVKSLTYKTIPGSLWASCVRRSEPHEIVFVVRVDGQVDPWEF